MISAKARIVPDPSDVDQCVLELPPEIVESLGWLEGDSLVWQAQADGSWTVSKTCS
jgi:hypothetical protein